MTGGCLGDVAAALVDGELDDAGRERAHRHLAHCPACRAEVEAQRRVKARLSGTLPAELPSALTERLLHLTVPGDDPAARDVRAPSRPAAAPSGAVRPGGSSPGGSSPGGGRPPGLRTRRAARRRATTASASVLLGVAAALALGGAQPREATTPVDPATDAFVTEFVSTTADGSSAVVPVPTARQAGLTTFVPLTRSALLSTGGARTTR